MRMIMTLTTVSITLNQRQDRPRPHVLLLFDHTIQTTSVSHGPHRDNRTSRPNLLRLRNSECPRMIRPERFRRMDSMYQYHMQCIRNGRGMKWLQIVKSVGKGLHAYCG